MTACTSVAPVSLIMCLVPHIMKVRLTYNTILVAVVYRCHSLLINQDL